MASRGLGTLTLDLVARIGGFTGPLDKAGRDLDKRMSAMEKRAYAFGRAIGTSLKIGAGIAAGALVLITKTAIDQADAIRDLSIRTGVSTEALSAYGYAATQTGTDLETVGKGIKILSKNMADSLNPTNANAKVFKELGINVLDSNKQLKNAADIIPELANKISSMEDGTTKAALMLQLFGKAGLDLTEFFNQGGAGLDAFAEKARALGIVIDEKTAAAADNFKDTLGDVHAAIGGLGLGIARELLPSLQDAASDLVELIKQGNLASDIASVMGASFRGAAAGLRFYSDAVQATSVYIEYLIKVSEGLKEVNANIQSFGLASGTVAAGIKKIKDATAEGDAALEAIHNPKKKPIRINLITADSGSIPDSALRTTDREIAANKKASDLERRLAQALSNPSAAKGGGKKASRGKSDAERQAEQLLTAYQRMESSYKEQLALVGEVTEVEKLRYELANGEGAKFSEAQKNTLLALAEQKDAQEAENKLTQEAKSLHEQLITPMEQINAERARAKELLDAGKISQEDYNRALDAQHTPAEQMLDDLRFEAELLGKSREQQELLTAARYLGAEAATEQGKAALAALEMEQDFRKSIETQTDIMDGARDSARLFFDDLKEGKGIWDSLIDGAGNFADILYDIAQRKLIEQIFGQMGTTGSGSSGGGWLDAIMSLFGGGGFGGEGSPLAGGGWTDPTKFHQVGEHNRPELLMRNGKQYLIPGDRGRVEPMSGGGSNSLTQIINYNTRERVDNRSRKQLAQAAGMSASEAIRSNRG